MVNKRTRLRLLRKLKRRCETEAFRIFQRVRRDQVLVWILQIGDQPPKTRMITFIKDGLYDPRMVDDLEALVLNFIDEALLKVEYSSDEIFSRTPEQILLVILDDIYDQM